MAGGRAIRGGARGRRRGTGASHSPPQAASATIAAAVDTEESTNGNQTSGGLATNDANIAMGLANADIVANLASLRVAVLALFSILTEEQIKVVKEMHAEENDEMLKEMLSHADSCLLARASTKHEGESRLISNVQSHQVVEGIEQPGAA